MICNTYAPFEGARGILPGPPYGKGETIVRTSGTRRLTIAVRTLSTLGDGQPEVRQVLDSKKNSNCGFPHVS